MASINGHNPEMHGAGLHFTGQLDATPGALAAEALPWWVRRELEQQLYRRVEELKDALRGSSPDEDLERRFRRTMSAQEALSSARSL